MGAQNKGFCSVSQTDLNSLVSTEAQAKTNNNNEWELESFQKSFQDQYEREIIRTVSWEIHVMGLQVELFNVSIFFSFFF